VHSAPLCPACGAQVREADAGARAPGWLLDRVALRPSEAAEVLGISERKLRQMLPRLRCVVRDAGVLLILPDLLREDLQRLAAEAVAARNEGAGDRTAERPKVDMEAEAFARDLREKAAAVHRVRGRTAPRVASEQHGSELTDQDASA
jgi:hypothetical protein